MYKYIFVLFIWTISSALVMQAMGRPAFPFKKNKVIRRIPTDANQGVAVGKDYYYAISNIRITKHSKSSNRVVATWEADLSVKKFEHFKHMNSGTVVDEHLYVAHSRYKVDPNDNTIEIFNVKDDLLEHVRTVQMPRKYGSLTWIDRYNGSWWMCYAVYGNDLNRNTKLVKYEFESGEFKETSNWNFPNEVVGQWGDMSCSGGSWSPEGKLYVTGHDHECAYVLELEEKNGLKYLYPENNVGFYGQAISWDRFTQNPTLWGIVKRKFITVAIIQKP